MRKSLIVNVVAVGLVMGSYGLVAIAYARNGPMAPGFEILSPERRQLAETPMVLNLKEGTQLCLELDDSDAAGQRVQLANCGLNWRQRVRLELQPEADGSTYLVRIGNFGCLTGSPNPGTRAQMSICGDLPQQERWKIVDSLLVDANGRCLEGQSLAANAPLLTAICNANAGNQQWSFSPMRSQFTQPADYVDPSGLDNRFFPIGFKSDVVEQFRPRFTPRTLTATERSELVNLKRTWLGSRPNHALQVYTNERTVPPVNIPWPVLLRFTELGETSDKDAMYAAMSAFALMSDTNRNGGVSGWTQADFPDANNPLLAWRVAFDLSNLWGAHFWHRHGADRLASRAFRAPSPVFMGCPEDGCPGYLPKFGAERPETHPFGWAKTGDAKKRFTVTELTFVPVGPSMAQSQARLIVQLNTHPKNIPHDTTFNSARVDWMAERRGLVVFASQTGQLQLWDNVNLNESFDEDLSDGGERTMRSILNQRRDAVDQRKAADEWRIRFDAFMAKPSPSHFEIWQMQRDLTSQSDADVVRFATRHPVNDALLPKLCGNGRQETPLCISRSRQVKNLIDRFWAERAAEAAQRDLAQANIQAARAQREERADAERATDMNKKKGFFDQLPALIEGFAAAGEASSQSVTVRTYDAAGNFTGTQTMTRAQAMARGATPRN